MYTQLSHGKDKPIIFYFSKTIPSKDETKKGNSSKFILETCPCGSIRHSHSERQVCVMTGNRWK